MNQNEISVQVHLETTAEMYGMFKTIDLSLTVLDLRLIQDALDAWEPKDGKYIALHQHLRQIVSYAICELDLATDGDAS